MPGFLDSLLSGVGSFFGGGDPSATDPFASTDPFSGGFTDPGSLFGTSDPTSLFGGATGGIDPSAFTSTPGLFDNFNWGSVDPSVVDPFASGGNPGGDWTPIPLQTAPTSIGITPPSLTNAGTPGNPFQIPPALMQTLTGISGRGGPPGTATTPTGPQGVPGSAVPGAGPSTNPISQLLGNNGGGILGTGLNLGQILGATGLGATLLGGPGTPPGSEKLSALADKNQALIDNTILPTALANQQGNISGTAMSQFERQLNEKQAAIRASYASQGESGSTMEAQDLGAARDATEQGIFAAGQQMASSGLNFASTITGQDVSMYNDVMQAAIAQDKEYRDAMAAFAAAAAGTTAPAAQATTVAAGG